MSDSSANDAKGQDAVHACFILRYGKHRMRGVAMSLSTDLNAAQKAGHAQALDFQQGVGTCGPRQLQGGELPADPPVKGAVHGG